MSNLRGPTESKRKLYYNVLFSTILYGAPIWYREIESNRSGRLRFRRVQSMIARRVICAYRTVSYDAACVLAGVPPIPILAEGRSTELLNLSVWDNGHLSSISGVKRIVV